MHTSIKTKKGAASIYVVVFTILLFSVITIAFAFLISSESGKTQNDTLSRAAYDASLAGVEDAKLAIMKYRNCLDGIGDNCDGDSGIIKTFEKGMKEKDCDAVSRILGRNGGAGGEVFVTETSDGTMESAMDQAYTCVVLNSVLSDYRANMTSTTGSKVIPLQVSDKDGSSYTIDSLDSVVISWYSAEDKGTTTATYTEVDTSTGKPEFQFKSADAGVVAPPILSVSYVQFPYTGIAIGPDSVGNDDTDDGNYQKSNHGQIWLVPVENSSSVYDDCNDATLASTNKCLIEKNINISGISTSVNPFAYSNYHKDDNYNDPYAVKCELEPGNDFLCSATIKVPKAYPAKDIDLSLSGGTAMDRLNGYCFLVISLPYGQPKTSIKVEMKAADGNTINFGEAQVAVDSTGRAADVYTRTETRIEMSDVNFPYPYYALQAFGNNSDGLAISKNFWAAKNCWYTEYDKDTGINIIKTCDGNPVH